MLSISIGHSEHVDEQDVVEEIVGQCSRQLNGETPQAGLMFAAVDYDYKKILEGFLQAWPGVRIVGCSTDGELSSMLGFLDDSVTVALFASDSIEITTGVGRHVSANIEAAAAAAVAGARENVRQAPSLCITTPASLLSSSDRIVEHLKSRLGPNVTLLGALAGDQWRLEETFQFFGTEVLTDAVPIILFSGPILFSKGIYSGWKPIGEVGTVTKSQGNVVHQIDNHPALEFFRRLLGEKAVPTGDRPLAILDDRGNVGYLRASIGQYDEEVGSVTFFGDIAEGSRVQITIATRDEILEGTKVSVARARDSYPDGKTPSAALSFSCSGRKLLLGTRTEQEYEILRQELGFDIPVVGFYGYGEIGPGFEDENSCKFHNETIVTVLLGA